MISFAYYVDSLEKASVLPLEITALHTITHNSLNFDFKRLFEFLCMGCRVLLQSHQLERTKYFESVMLSCSTFASVHTAIFCNNYGTRNVKRVCSNCVVTRINRQRIIMACAVRLSDRKARNKFGPPFLPSARTTHLPPQGKEI